MSMKIVAFRLKDDLKYEARYMSLMRAINGLTATKWDQGTSLYFLWHSGSAEETFSAIKAASFLYPDDDMLLVYDSATGECAYSGVDNPGLLDFVLRLGTGAALSPRQQIVNALMGR